MNTAFEGYGFAQTPVNHRNVITIDVTFADHETTQKVFAVAQEAKASAIATLKDKVAQVEGLWEQDRISAVNARSEVQRHKQQELLNRNDVVKANNAMNNAFANLSNLRNAVLDVYASRNERNEHQRKIVAAEARADEAQQEALKVNGLWDSYISAAERLAAAWNKAQANFAERAEHLNMLKKQLAELEPELAAEN